MYDDVVTVLNSYCFVRLIIELLEDRRQGVDVIVVIVVVVVDGVMLLNWYL